MEQKLTPLPCPFCGKHPKVVPSRPEIEGNAWGAVICVNERCAVMPQCRDGSQIADERGPGAYKDLAIKRWNKRKVIAKSNDKEQNNEKQ